MAKVKKDKIIGNVTVERAVAVMAEMQATATGHDTTTMSELTAAQVILLETSLKQFCWLNKQNAFGFDYGEKMLQLVEHTLAQLSENTSFKKDSIKVERVKINGKWCKDASITSAQQHAIAHCGVVAGQCLAQMLGAKWVYSDIHMQYAIAHEGTEFNVINKAFKFMINGCEDSLLGTYFVLLHKKANDEMFSKVHERIKDSLGDNYCVQHWHTDGKLTKTLYLDKTTRAVLLFPTGTASR